MFFICRGIVASILVFLCFGVTQAKDGPFSRPHPGNLPFLFPCVPVWRFCSERSLCVCAVGCECPARPSSWPLLVSHPHCCHLRKVRGAFQSYLEVPPPSATRVPDPQRSAPHPVQQLPLPICLGWRHSSYRPRCPSGLEQVAVPKAVRYPPCWQVLLPLPSTPRSYGKF